MASLLYPRRKGGVGIQNADKDCIWQKIRDKSVVQIQQRKEEAQAKPGQVNNQVNIHPIELPINHAATSQPNDLDVMFEDLNQFCMEEHY
jgi:hypothetical protein